MTVLVLLLVGLSLFNLILQIEIYRDLRRWLDAIGELVGEALDHQE